MVIPESNGYDPKPIEEYFPIAQVNEIADKESKAKRYYRPVYTMHKWWARRLGSVFRTILLYSLADENMNVVKDEQKSLTEKKWSGDPEKLWDFYLEDVDFDGKIVLDPFFGGGTTIVEALRMGCNVIGKELNPVAWFVTKKEIEPVDPEKLDETFEKLKEAIAPEIKKYYETTCPECGEKADTMYYFWVKELNCRNCGTTISLFKDYRIAKNRSNNVEHKHKTICKNCGEAYKPGKNCPECGEEFNHKDYYHLLCPECGEIFGSPNYKEENTCPYCENKFNPKKDGNASGKYFTCKNCWQKNEIIKTIDEQGKPEERLWAVEYYCENCDKKGYKPAKEEDQDLYLKAKEKYEKKKEDLPIPQQEIPPGVKTRELNNHGYEYFKEMFNKRQLLSLGLLYREILNIEEKRIREALILVFSESLDYQNKFCTYERARNHSGHLFSKHAYHSRHMYVENNGFGIQFGRGTFKKTFKQTREGFQYQREPFEKYREEGETKEKKMSIDISRDKNDKIVCGDSSYLEIEDKTVDTVITDPPYFDNVMYSELSDFYYVWLRDALKDTYDCFNARYTPKSGEVVKNTTQGK
ncbi:hypothetical protein AKJ49_01580, partial [candidate division MSBL1 archaeon SCGC-AAA382A03]